jgi:hypothetical protein
MALLICQGTVGWMRAWPRCDIPVNIQKYLSSNAVAPQPLVVPSALHGQITVLLANMVLNGQRRVVL